MKNQKMVVFMMIAVLVVGMLSGCGAMSYNLSEFMSSLAGRSMTVSTYDEDSQMIDRVKGTSIDVAPDNKFQMTDSEGTVVEKSSVLNLTVGGNPMIHVGSSLIAYEDGLTDVFNEYSKTVDIQSVERSTPFMNRMVNDMKNLTTGNNFVILIRSQTGKPLATFVGNDVSYFATDIDKSTAFIVDGKYLFVYRCDYTIYDMDNLQ